MNQKNSALIIGASGRTGAQIIRQLDANTNKRNKLKVFAFCRDPSKLDPKTKAHCTGVLKGNARLSTDLEKAIQESEADLVVVSIGNGDSVKKTDIRTSSAQALVQVLSKPKYQHVQVLVVSSTGAGGSRIKVGFGIGRMIEFHLRHVLKDHNGQEAAFLSSSAMKNRTMIVRPTALVENEATGKLVSFGDLEKSPTIQTDRKDLADWLIKEAVLKVFEEGGFGRFGSRSVNLTGLKMK